MKKPTLVLILCTLVLSACSALGNLELNNARSRWQGSGITHYRFNLRVACFCAFMDKMPLTIEVQDGRVISMQYSNGTPVSDADRLMFERYETIDKLFDFTAQSLKDADELQVVYDQAQGFPRQVQIDFIKQAADDELGLFVTNFQAVQ